MLGIFHEDRKGFVNGKRAKTAYTRFPNNIQGPGPNAKGKNVHFPLFFTVSGILRRCRGKNNGLPIRLCGK